MVRKVHLALGAWRRDTQPRLGVKGRVGGSWDGKPKLHTFLFEPLQGHPSPSAIPAPLCLLLE